MPTKNMMHGNQVHWVHPFFQMNEKNFYSTSLTCGLHKKSLSLFQNTTLCMSTYLLNEWALEI